MLFIGSLCLGLIATEQNFRTQSCNHMLRNLTVDLTIKDKTICAVDTNINIFMKQEWNCENNSMTVVQCIDKECTNCITNNTFLLVYKNIPVEYNTCYPYISYQENHENVRVQGSFKYVSQENDDSIFVCKNPDTNNTNTNIIYILIIVLGTLGGVGLVTTVFIHVRRRKS